MDNLSESYLDVISDHRRWLKVFGEQRLQRWEALLGHNSEAAICEAYVRMLLAEYVETVEPNENLVDGGPDFFCNQNNSNHFYVEVTSMSISTVTRITGLDHPLPRDSGSQYFGLLTRKILGEICNKASQCSDMNAPCVLAIGTLHTHAGHICMDKRAAEQLLTGTSFITAPFDSETGEITRDLYNATDLRDSSFVRANRSSPSTIQDARRTVSALLLCSLGTKPPRMIGVLHPNPIHTFNRALLQRVQFARLADDYQDGKFKVEWI